jgi:hypothetical protein
VATESVVYSHLQQTTIVHNLAILHKNIPSSMVGFHGHLNGTMEAGNLNKNSGSIHRQTENSDKTIENPSYRHTSLSVQCMGHAWAP